MSGSIFLSEINHNYQRYLQHPSYRESGPTVVPLSSLRRRLDASLAQATGGGLTDNSDEESLISEQPAPPQITTYDHKQWTEQLAAANLDPQDVNKLVMDYFAICGHKDAAEAFARESNTPLPSLSRTIAVRDELRRHILGGRIPQARALISERFPKVAEDEAILFELLQQELIELVRRGQPVEALAFSQGDLAKMAVSNPEFMQSLEQVMLLAFIPGIKDGNLPEGAPNELNSFWEEEHRSMVHTRVLEAILSAECGRTEPRLPGVLKQLHYEQDRARKSFNFPKMVDLATGALEPPPNPPASSEAGGPTSSPNGATDGDSSSSVAGASATGVASSSVASSVAGSSSSSQQAYAAAAAAAAAAQFVDDNLMALAPMSDDPPAQPPLPHVHHPVAAALQLQESPVPLVLQPIVAAVQPPQPTQEDPNESQEASTDDDDDDDDDSAMVDS